MILKWVKDLSTHLFKEDIPVAVSSVKICSTSQFTRKVQYREYIKTEHVQPYTGKGIQICVKLVDITVGNKAHKTYCVILFT